MMFEIYIRIAAIFQIQCVYADSKDFCNADGITESSHKYGTYSIMQKDMEFG